MYEPEKYSKHLEPLVNYLINVYGEKKKFLKWNSEAESILDLGIGDGRIANEVIFPIIPKNIKEFIGADISEVMLKYAKMKISHEKFKVFMIDALTKSIPVELKNRFHHIFSSFLLHLFRDIRPLLLNVQEMLKPGGQFMFNVLAETLIDEAFEKLDQGKWGKYNHREGNSPFYKSENVVHDYEKLIKSLGFVNCYVYSGELKFVWPLETYEEFLISLNTRLPFIQEDDKEEYMKDYIEQTKKIRRVKITTDKETNKKLVHVSMVIVTGIMSKPI